MIPLMFSTIQLISTPEGSAQRLEARIERHFPQVTVRILEVAGVAAIERRLRSLDDLRPRLLRLPHDRVDFLPGGDVVADGELERAGCLQGQAAVRGEALAWPQGQLQSRAQVEEGDRAILQLRADDALRAESQAIPVERDGALEVIDPEGE